jgi:hypothetical protein
VAQGRWPHTGTGRVDDGCVEPAEPLERPCGVAGHDDGTLAGVFEILAKSFSATAEFTWKKDGAETVYS